MRLALGCSTAALLAVSGVSYAQPGSIPAPRIDFKAGHQSVPFVLFRGNRIIVQGSLNGHPTRVMLDSGTSVTTLDRSYARSIGLPPGIKVEARGAGGVVEAETVANVTLELGGVRFEKMTVAVMDLEAVARDIGRPIDVIVGRELFNSAVITIDWAASGLTLSSPQAFRPPQGAMMVELGKAGPFNTIPVSVGGGEQLIALLDIGNGGNLILPANYWKQRPDIAHLPFADSQAGGVGGAHAVRSVTLPIVTFGGQSLTRVPATLSERANDGHATSMPNVGIGLLRPFRVSLDLGRSRLYLTPVGQPSFPRDRAGVRSELHGSRLKIAFVSPGSPAASAGLKAGDEIVAVNGRPVDPDFYASQDWALGPAGRQILLKRGDGSTATLILADYF